MPRTGRPKAEYDIKQFVDLIGLGCDGEEICWWFRDETGKPANIDTLSRWCVRTFGMTFQDYRRQNGAMALKIKVRRNQVKLSEKSASMAIWLGKQYLNQRDTPIEEQPTESKVDQMTAYLFKEQERQRKEEEAEDEYE